VQNQRVLHRLPVIPLSGPDDPEPASQVHGPGAGIRLPDLEKDFPPSTKLEFADARFKEYPANPPAAMVGIYREVQHFTLAGDQPSQKVPLKVLAYTGYKPKADRRGQDLTKSLGTPRIAEAATLEDAEGGRVSRRRWPDSVAVVHGCVPTEPAPRRAGRSPAPTDGGR